MVLLMPCLSQAQKVTDVSTQVDGEYVTIFYTLVDGEEMEGRLYDVSLYAIINQTDTVALQEVDGDVGEIAAGEHFIQWNVKQEFDRFRGTVAFEVRASPLFVITRPIAGSVFKRGGSYFLKWYGGGSHSDSLRIELFRDGEFVAVIDTVADETKTLWRIPPRMKAGNDFQLHIEGTEKTGIDEYSDYFTIRRKIPLWAQLAPLAVAAAVLVGLLPSEPSGSGPLPPPPLPKN